MSFVLRLRPDELSTGELVGQVEDVATGDSARVRSLDELVGFLRAHATVAAPAQRPAPQEPTSRGKETHA